MGRAIDKIADHVDYHLVGRIKEMPVAGFSAISVEANAEGFAPSMAGRAIDPSSCWTRSGAGSC